jgi:hypothetical protein
MIKEKQKMKQIRKSVFETNSSSTHSIAIPKNGDVPRCVYFCTGDFGWAWEEVEATDYFYTAIYETSITESEAQAKIKKLKDILEAHGVEYHFTKPKTHMWCSDYDHKEYLSLDDGYIDHGYELQDFVDELLNDENKLLRFLGGGLVFTGNDNSTTEEQCFIKRYKKFLDDYNWRTKQEFKIENPYYMSNHKDYDWYYKGN